jgi:hypothetical protein
MVNKDFFRIIFIVCVLAVFHVYSYHSLGNKLFDFLKTSFISVPQWGAVLVSYFAICLLISTVIVAVLFVFKIVLTKTISIFICSLTIFSLLPSFFWGYTESRYMVLMRVAQILIVPVSLLSVIKLKNIFFEKMK